MSDQKSKNLLEVMVAELVGYLDGVSYLNRDRRSHFASAFMLKADDDEGILQGINAVFKENPIPPFVIEDEQGITYSQLETELSASILVNSFVSDNQQENDLRRYISFKVLDRVDDVIGTQALESVKKLQGSWGATEGLATFYCLTRTPHTLVIYIFAAEKTSNDNRMAENRSTPFAI